MCAPANRCVDVTWQCFNLEPLVHVMERTFRGDYRCPTCRAPLVLDELVVSLEEQMHITEYHISQNI